MTYISVSRSNNKRSNLCMHYVVKADQMLLFDQWCKSGWIFGRNAGVDPEGLVWARNRVLGGDTIPRFKNVLLEMVCFGAL